MCTGKTTQIQILTLLLTMSVISGCLSDTPPGGSNFAPDPGIGGGNVLNNAPTISGSPNPAIVIGNMYLFTPSASDADDDTLTFSIRNRPDWATFDSTTGQLSGQALLGDEGVYNNIGITVSDGNLAASLPDFSITVTQRSPSNAAPTISGTPPAQINANSPYNFSPIASDADGDNLTFSVGGLPGWASFNNSNASITGTPSVADVGTYSGISITVSDGNASATLGPFSITVVAVDANAAPTISGSPPAQVNANDPYSFTPTASDADGDDLTFSVSGLPGWASFSSSNGRISGTPGDADVRTYSNIRITVSDGNASATLGPFSITVADDNANAAPTISGSPPAQVNANDPYAFTPTASDTDGDDLTFSVSGLPGWASFNTSNGALTGTPADADVGVYSDIRISVSDGTASATLGPFSITVNAISVGSVTLSWTPPTKNDDGTELTDLAGYKFYWGTGSGSYPNSTKVYNPGISSYVIENLAPGTYEFVATSFNSADVESVFSNVAVKIITSN